MQQKSRFFKFFFNRKGDNNKGENPNMMDKNYLPQIHKSTILVLKFIVNKNY